MHGIAVVGGGNMGRTHARAWSQLGLGEAIRFVCTPRPGAAFPHAPSARLVSDFDEVLADPMVDLVSVCTPTPAHADLAIRSLRAGRHVLLEKPIALRLDDAEAIAAAARESSGIVMVAHVVRFFSGYRRVRADAESGRLGVIREVRASRLSATPTWSQWLTDDARSGGMLVDFAIHDFDQLNLLLGRPVSVSTVERGGIRRFETTVEYADGGVGHVVTCGEMPAGTSFSSSLDVVGSVGTASCRVPEAAPDDPFTRQAESFLRSVDAGTVPEVSISSAICALQVALAARESLHTGRAVDVSSATPEPPVTNRTIRTRLGQ
ncbi:Gfo/Idh/MocA family protein [Agromyces laixinhei]|uniref:Gfo/Idh/MocA family protein n=1 Tax=Agromyces laixinhei TaxID=2585717 RepID=UPI0012EDC211|nr:Gfo/Idh/MocA family oxidoreductase [Agromyces laixinhei]